MKITLFKSHTRNGALQILLTKFTPSKHLVTPNVAKGCRDIIIWISGRIWFWIGRVRPTHTTSAQRMWPGYKYGDLVTKMVTIKHTQNSLEIIVLYLVIYPYLQHIS